MKRKGTLLLAVLTLFFGAFCAGFFLGRNLTAAPVLVTEIQASNPPETTAATAPAQETTSITFPVNINTADKEALMALPGIGEVLAQRILDHRSSNGPFEAVTELMDVEGIGEQRLETLLPYATIGG